MFVFVYLKSLVHFGVHEPLKHKRPIKHNTTHTHAMFKRHYKVIAQEDFDRDFERENTLLSPGFEPTTF